MTVRFHRDFRKQLKKQPVNVRNRFYERLAVLKTQPRARILRNHLLEGQWQGRRGIDVTGDVRAIYREDSQERVTFVAIGTHAQLYR